MIIVIHHLVGLHVLTLRKAWILLARKMWRIWRCGRCKVVNRWCYSHLVLLSASDNSKKVSGGLNEAMYRELSSMLGHIKRATLWLASPLTIAKKVPSLVNSPFGACWNLLLSVHEVFPIFPLLFLTTKHSLSRHWRTPINSRWRCVVWLWATSDKHTNRSNYT